MTTSAEARHQLQRSILPTSALARHVEFADQMMFVHLQDGRIIGVPLLWFPRLRDASPQQRANYEIGGGGIGLHWPDIDEDISVAGLMAGADLSPL